MNAKLQIGNMLGSDARYEWRKKVSSIAVLDLWIELGQKIREPLLKNNIHLRRKCTEYIWKDQ